MEDIRCALLEGLPGRTDEQITADIRVAMAIDAQRATRLVMASLQDDGDVRQYLMDEIPQCVSCYRSLMVHLAGRCAALYESQFDGGEKAMEILIEERARDLGAEGV